MKKLFFLAGMPRSGSTLLGSILNKHRDVHVTPTSPILDLICMTEESLKKLSVQYTFNEIEFIKNIAAGILDYGYKHISKPIVFDKHRGWPKNIKIATSLLSNNFSGIVTYRPLPEIITSYIKLAKKDPNNFIDARLRDDGRPINNRNRADYLWRYYISDSYNSIKVGLEQGKDRLLPISYDDITLDTKNTLKKIEAFFSIDGISNIELDHIENTCAEDKDVAWGLKDLHTIRPKIDRTSDDPVDILGQDLFNYYSQFNWKL